MILIYAHKWKRQITKVYVNNIQYLNSCGAKHHLEPSKGSWIAPKVSSLGAETIVICEGTIPESRSNLWSEGAPSMMKSCPKNKFPCLQGGATYFETTNMNFHCKNKQQALQGRETGVDDAVVKVSWEMVVKGLVPDCLVGSTAQRWRCGERRKTARWTSVLRAQVHGCHAQYAILS